MDKIETRRINPVSHLATVVVVIIVIIELLVIGGIVHLRAESIRRFVPWAYDAFVRLEYYIDQQADLEPTSIRENTTLTDFSSILPTNLIERVSSTNTVDEIVAVDAIETNQLVNPLVNEVLLSAPVEEVSVTNAPSIIPVVDEDVPVG